MDQVNRRLVLVVDDDTTTQLIAKKSLIEGGYEVELATNGAQAIQRTTELQPDIIILDIEMPEVNGIEACTEIRKLTEHARTPIIMLTSHEDQQSIESAYAAGATDFATKPVNWTLLKHRLRYVIRNTQVLTELSTAQNLARLGSWRWSAATDTITWSEGLRILSGLEASQPSGFGDVLAIAHPDDRAALEREIERAKLGKPMALSHRGLEDENGTRVYRHQAEARLNRYGMVTEIVGTVLDVTDRHHDAEQIQRLAYFDSTTGLPNRRSFIQRLERDLNLAERAGQSTALLYLDLDGFKRVNDSHGHAVGDHLLRLVADRVVTRLQSAEVGELAEIDNDNPVSRLGGDELALLVRPRVGALQHDSVAEILLNALSEPFAVDGDEILISASVGIAVFPTDAETGESLLKNAGVAMYAAKRGGKGNYRVFSESMGESALNRLTIENQMRGGLERGEFSLHYQPQLDLISGRVSGLEALLRWSNRELGNVPPDQFIGIAEEVGLIVPIGEWVLRTACAQARSWLDAGVSVQRIAVNVSVVQFMEPDFPSLVARVLDDTRLPAHHLELEITEGLLMTNIGAAIRILDALKSVGVQLAIDDFGTGYSSLSYLKRFPIDRLKIDRSFVHDITASPNDATICSAVAAMATSMHLGVVAEGVETRAQLELLRRQGCGEIQGFLFSRPLPAEQCGEFLQDLVYQGEFAAPSDAPRRSALFVDDDPIVLGAIETYLSTSGVQVLTATRVAEAFELLAQHEIGVVFADYEMPDLNGAEFLSAVRKLSPSSVRIMLSGQSDRGALISAINEGALYKFLPKPIDWHDLETTLFAALRAAYPVDNVGGAQDAAA